MGASKGNGDSIKYNLDMNPEILQYTHPADAWLFSIPDDPYDPCPCGCGTSWRYVAKKGEEEIGRHYDKFAAEFLKMKEAHS